MLYLLLGIALELLRAEPLASTELQGLLAERSLQHIAEISIGLVYDVVECRSGKVTQQDRLRVCRGLQTVDNVGQRVVSIVLKTGCQRRDIDQHVRLHHLKSVIQSANLQPLEQLRFLVFQSTKRF